MSDIVSPIQNTSYTNKDFVRIYEELLDLAKELSSKWDPSLSNESDPGVILLKLNAIIADKCNYNIDKSVLECFPLSVTQLPNARQLFEQLGYYMHWRRSATTPVTINWVSEDLYPTEYAVINPFTMVTDKESSIIYTLLGPYDGISDYSIGTMQLLCDGASSSAIKCNAIQGVPIDFTISGDKLITVNNLDENNRLYFPDTNVAENGVFITNSDDNSNYNKWQRKDNLSVENFGNYYYKFGVTLDGNNCYIEFPEDVETLFQEGIYIKYIRTDSTYGNINANTLYQFYDSITSNLSGKNIILNADTVSITNPYSANNGASYEMINEAYKNYKHTVGTFNTLVTLRDYINAIYNSGLVSNCFVCDRTNDIQSTYKVLTSVNNVDQTITYIEEEIATQPNPSDPTSEVSYKIKSMDAFSLKLYLLNYSAITTDYSSYINTFEMMTNDDTNVEVVKKYIESEKSIQHDYQNILDPGDVSPHPVYFRNIYPIECTITAQTVLNPQQKAEIRTNIIEALHNNLSSKQVDFGEAISYDLIYNIISNADPRIKYVSLFNINYATDVVYYDSTSKLTYIVDPDTNVGAWYDDEFVKTYPSYYGLSSINPTNGATLNLPATFKHEFINGDNYDDIYYCSNTITTVDGNKVERLPYIPVNQRDSDHVTMVDVDPVIFYSKLGLENCYKKQLFTCSSVEHNYSWEVAGQKVDLTDFGISVTGTLDVGDTITATFGSSMTSPSVSGTGVTATLSDSSKFTTKVSSTFPAANQTLTFTYVDDNSVTATWQLNGSTVDLAEYGITINPSATVEEGDQFKVKLSYGHQVKYDVIAKSILVGSTPFYIKDETFDYRLNQRMDSVRPLIPNVAKMCGDVEIDFTTQKSVYQLRNNESLQLYAPNLTETATYSNYVKFEYYITQDVTSNSNYQLRNNEFIIFYWTQSDDEAGLLYHYQCYGNGTVISPTFNMTLKTINDKNDTIAVKYNLVKYDTNGNTVDSSWSKDALMSLSAGEEVSAITSTKNILSGSKKICIRTVNELTITRMSQYYLYWVLNDALPDAFNQDRYILFNVGETSRMLGAGEYLMYTDAYKKNYEVLGEGTLLTRNSSSASTEWSVIATDPSEVLLNGLTTLEGKWFTLGDTDVLNITENAFTNIGSGCSISVSTKDPKTTFYTTSISGSVTGLVTSFDEGVWYQEHVSAGTYTLTYSSSTTKWTLTQSGIEGSTEIDDITTQGITIDSSKLANNVTITVTVLYSYKLVFTREGYQLYIPESNTTPSDIPLSNFVFKYKLAGTDDSEDNWITVDDVTLNGTIGWNGRSLLSIDIGPSTSQYLLSNQSIHLYDADNNALSDIVGGNKTYYITYGGTLGTSNYSVDTDIWNVENPLAGEYTYTYVTDHWVQNLTVDDVATTVNVDLTSLGITVTGTPTNNKTIIITNQTPIHYPTVVQGSMKVDSYGTEFVKTYVEDYDNNGASYNKYLELYVFAEMQDIIGEVIYSSNGTVALTFKPEDPYKEIQFSIPSGTYILPVKNNIDELTNLTVKLDGTYLRQMYADVDAPADSDYQLKTPGLYYLRMNLTSDTLHTLRIDMGGHTMNSSIALENCYRYTKPQQFGKSSKTMSDDEFNKIEDLIRYLDYEHRFKYNNEVSSSRVISDPAAASSFNNVNHIYNPFTICEFSTAIIN